MRWFISFALLGAFATAQANAAEWNWLRVEAGIPNAVVMQGQAVTVSERAGQWTVKLSDRDKVVNDFVVRIRRSGEEVIAEFEPPNTERVTLQVKGIRRVSPAGRDEVFEELIFANLKGGNFLLLSRFKKTK